MYIVYMNISILIPTYNRRKFLPLLIDNVISQTYNHSLLELVILDDGEELLIEDIEEFKNLILPIKLNYVIEKKRLPIGTKRNKLVKLAKHKIVCFMDDDDIYNDNYIKYSYEELTKNKAGLTGSNQMLFIYPFHNFKKSYINCGDNKRLIHECSMMMTKKYFNSSNKFEKSSQGEGKQLILDNDKRVINLDASKLLVQLCHKENTINKEQFINKNVDIFEFNCQRKINIIKQILNIK
jgi:glycosyltransferase involved in cell wall biosynthesis